MSAGIGLVHTVVCTFHNSDHDPMVVQGHSFLSGDFDGSCQLISAWQHSEWLACLAAVLHINQAESFCCTLLRSVCEPKGTCTSRILVANA